MSTIQKQSLHLLSLSAPDLDEYLDACYDENPILFREDGPMFRGQVLSEERPDLLETLTANEEDALDDLFLQLHAVSSDPLLNKVGDYLIASLDERGYLSEGWEDAAEAFDLAFEELEEIVYWLQNIMDPAGVFARDLQECLLIQAARFYPRDYALQQLLEEQFSELAEGDFRKVASALECSVSEVESLVSRVRQMEPNPLNGSPDRGPVRYRVPELEFRVEGEELHIIPLERNTAVSINPFFADARQQGVLTPAEILQMKGYYEDARQLVYALEQRQRTLLRVATRMAEVQKDHFLSGSPLTGLTEGDLADGLGISISTVSRTIKEKYYLFENKTYCLSDLLCTKLSSGISRDEVCFLITSLIGQERGDKPLSDAFIAHYCTSNGHPVSRRAIAKYRQELGIPSSSERKHLA